MGASERSHTFSDNRLRQSRDSKAETRKRDESHAHKQHASDGADPNYRDHLIR